MSDGDKHTRETENRERGKGFWLDGRGAILNCGFREGLTEKVTKNQGQKEELEERTRRRVEALDSKILNPPGGVGSVESPGVSLRHYYSAGHTASAK